MTEYAAVDTEGRKYRATDVIGGPDKDSEGRIVLVVRLEEVPAKAAPQPSAGGE